MARPCQKRCHALRAVALAAVCLTPAAGLGAQGTATSPGALKSVSIAAARPGSLDQEFFTVNSGLLIIRSSTLVEIVADAYGVRTDAVVGGPAWVATDPFDIVAHVDSSVTQAQAGPLLQQMLAKRFGLVVHRENRPLPVYVLTAASKNKLTPAAAGHEPGCDVVRTAPARAADGARAPRLVRRECHNLTMGALAALLPQMAPAYIDHPVMDKTGLTGAYDFPLAWLSRMQLNSPGDPSYDPSTDVSIFDTLAQLGLHLDARTAPVSAVVIDRANEIPTGMLKAAPAPTEFEVAEVKPSRPDEKYQPFPDRVTQGGEVNLYYTSLQDMIELAYGIGRDRLVGAPSWLDADHFDIAAKIANPKDYSLVGLESIRQPMRRLLADRFKLAIHDSVQPITVYALAPNGRPKLSPGAATDRPGCEASTGNGMIVYTCRATSMATLADALPGLAQGYLHHPVVDRTGLTGTYNFAISWTPLAHFLRGSRSAASAGGGVAAVPNRDLNIFQALKKQLGLKLVTEKQPMPVKVIDHIERMPVGN